jgi:hypothetical protein
LLADEMGVAVMLRLTRHPQMEELRQKYRQFVTGALLDGVPKKKRPAYDVAKVDLWAYYQEHDMLPTDADAYVANQLTRQQVLLDSWGDEDLDRVARERVLERFETALATRKLAAETWSVNANAEPTWVGEMRSDAVVVASSDGQIFGALIVEPGTELYLFDLAVGTDKSMVFSLPLPESGPGGDGVEGVQSMALVTPESAVVLAEDPPLLMEVSLGGSEPGRVLGLLDDEQWDRLVAVDPQGGVWTASTSADFLTWRVGPLEDGQETSKYSILTDDGLRHWGDGPLGDARMGTVTAFVVDGDGRVVLTDGARKAIRRVGPDGLETLLGQHKGMAAGRGPAGALFYPAGLTPCAEGLWLLDRGAIPAEGVEVPSEAWWLRRVETTQ